jgi:O-antigen ligase
VFAFGGTYQWTTVPLLAGIVCMVAIEQPRIARPPFRIFDAAVIVCLAVVALQLIPLPFALRRIVSPAAVAFDRAMRLDLPSEPLSGPAGPVSLDPASTAWALSTGIGVALLFWSARSVFARGGVRLVTRGTAWMGLVVAGFAIVQHATAPTLLYWAWQPASPAARPYGPFVNRNDLACWLVMAIPLTVGYAVARVRSRRRRDNGEVDLVSAVDNTAIWLAASACSMLGGLFVSLSRSGITACAAALVALVLISRKRVDRQRGGWLLAGLAIIVAIGTTYANFGALADRVGDTLAAGIGGRRAIWRETWVMARDFWRTGVGVGAYVRGMLVYQTSPRQYFYFNHAHNEFLQIFAEGGVLLSIPAAVALVTAAKGIACRLREDRSAAFWIRAGAASGMIAVVVESVWDTGLRMPANAVLFAILAAMALREVDVRTRGEKEDGKKSMS